MRLKIKKYRRIIIISLIAVLLLIFSIELYAYIRVKTAKIEVKLVSNLKIEFNEEVKISDLISSINGEILSNKAIDTTKLGKQTISFKFKNDDGITVPYYFDIEVVDTTEPLIWINNSYILSVIQPILDSYRNKKAKKSETIKSGLTDKAIQRSN